MVNRELAEDYIKRARIRLKILDEYIKQKDYADVIRTCQEIVELSQKAILINIGISPPKLHDVIDIILENREKLPKNIVDSLKKLRKDSKWLRAYREIAFYGEIDFVPSRDFTINEAKKAITIAKKFLEIIDKLNE